MLSSQIVLQLGNKTLFRSTVLVNGNAAFQLHLYFSSPHWSPQTVAPPPIFVYSEGSSNSY